jgi:phosphatidylserine/phosphatidylglycerophosphate/cardiolipin synthase-like enzyme
VGKPSATRPILDSGGNTWCEARADESGVFIDAADYYRAFYAAARGAEHSILLSGWQFDSGVPLLRGPEVPAGAEVRFLRFLNGLCEEKAALRVYILAWDFHLVFAHEREWMQRVLFHWMTNPRFRFQFHNNPVTGSSHHQKFVVVDGTLAFVGGMDLCEARWDDRCHRADNPWRVSRGVPVKPYHDVQAYLVGPDTARALQALFIERWTSSAGAPPEGLAPVTAATAAFVPRPAAGAMPFGGGPVALSRTDPRANGATIREVERLFVDALDAAEHLIYIETQYFSSRRIHQALLARMRAPGRAPLQIVVIVNERAEALKEELAVGLRQAEILEHLRRAARDTGHALGIYHSLCDGSFEAFRATYIHSKLMIVDDRFLTVGSANLTNRSMALDSELHVSWEAVGTAAVDRRLRRAIRRLRVSLLAEHSGLAGPGIRGLVRVDALVARLDALASRPPARLQPLGPPTAAQRAVMELVDPQELPFDSEVAESPGPIARDEPDDQLPPAPRTALGRLVAALRRR